jgi:Sec-independent protein translocase protein TatA
VVLLVVWAVVLVLVAVVLGGLAYGLLGAFGRLRREVAGAERDLRPLLEQLQQTSNRMNERADKTSQAG